MDATLSSSALPGLDVLAPGAAALKRNYKKYLGRGLAAAVVFHLVLIGIYWAVTEFKPAPPPPEEMQIVAYNELAPPPSIEDTPPPPNVEVPAPAAAPIPTGTPTPVPDEVADTTTTLPTQEEMASTGDMPLPTLGVRGGTGVADAAPPAPPPPPPPPPPEPEPEIFEVVEQMPSLEGGIAGLQSRIEYPEFARRAGIEGRVFVQFVVDEQGNPSDIRVVRGIGGGCDEAAVAAVRASHFTPGLQRGRPVKVRMSLPVTFRLN